MENETGTRQIEHDHTQLDVLFEDLHAVGRQAIAAASSGVDLEILEDARTGWSFLHEEIARHFGKEERKLFAVLAQEYPDLKDEFAKLSEQHLTLRRTIADVGLLLKGEPEQVAQRQDEFQTRWSGLEDLWKAHSETEWEILRTVEDRRGGSRIALSDGV